MIQVTDVDDEERQEAAERLQRFDWSFAKGEDIVYGWIAGTEDDWLVLPRSAMEDAADTPRNYDEDGIPDWQPDSAMAGWLPSEVMDEYGLRRFDLGGSEFQAIVDIEGLLDGLRSVGAKCERDDVLVDAAFNGR